MYLKLTRQVTRFQLEVSITRDDTSPDTDQLSYGGAGQTLRKNKQSLYITMHGSVIQHPSKVKETE